MSPAEFSYVNHLEYQVALLVHAARVAHAQISADRESLYQCHFDPVKESVVDQLGMQGLIEYDEALGTLQRAIDAADGQQDQIFFGLVYFKYTTNGWRIVGCRETGLANTPLPLPQVRIEHWQDLLKIEGTFHRRPRLHTFCKRPHKEIVHA